MVSGYLDTILMNCAILVVPYLRRSIFLVQRTTMPLLWILTIFSIKRTHGRRIPLVQKPVSFKIGFCKYIFTSYFTNYTPSFSSPPFFVLKILIYISFFSFFFKVALWISSSLPHMGLVSTLKLDS